MSETPIVIDVSDEQPGIPTVENAVLIDEDDAALEVHS